MDSETPPELRQSEPSGKRPLTQAEIRQVFVGIMLAMLVAALDQTIVATALPTIGRDLDDVAHLPWVVTAYLLAATAVTPLYGKFSDMHGRRVTMLIGLSTFLVGSIACALAPSMLILIGARALQGLGGGGLISLAQTIIADMVSMRERGKYQVYFAAVFAFSSISGPVLGGFIAERLHWSFIFWINLPLVLIALWLTNSRLRLLPRPDRQHRLDILGAFLMTGATISLMLALSSGGSRLSWTSPGILGLLGLSLVLWLSFALRLRVAREPLIAPEILLNRVAGFALPSAALAMGTFIALTIYVPIFFETELGLSARQSGLALIPFMIGTVIGSTVSGRLMAVVEHYKRLPVAGLTVSMLAVGSLSFVDRSWPLWAIDAPLMLASMGFGTVMPVTTVAVQNAVERHQLGTATAASNFFRQLAGAIIVAVFGAIAFAGAGVSLESAGGAAAAATGTYRHVFGAATFLLACALALLVMMEERPFSTRPVLSAPSE